MIQIISNSNETSTGPELVQNGDFSQLGTDVVENGEFDELGTDVITNGNFATDTNWTKGNGWSIGDNKATSTQALGSEEVTNGDFSDTTAGNIITNPNFTDTGSDEITDGSFPSGTTAWSFGSGWSLGTDEAICVANGGFDALNQGSVMNSGSSYKVTYTADLSLITSGTLKLGTFSNSATERTVLDGTNTVYLTANGGTFQVNEGGAVGTATITNISVKELGADWNDLGSPLAVASFDENGLTITSLNGDGIGNRVNQSLVTEASTSYKVTYTIHSANLTGSNTLRYYNGNSYIELPTAITGTPQTLYYTTASTITNSGWFFRLATTGGSTTDNVTISSIIVEELGEGWGELVNTEPIFNASGLTLSTSNGFEQRPFQEDVIISGNSYKVTYALSAASYTTGSTLDYYDGDSFVNLPEQGVGTHTFYYTASNPANDRWYFNLRKGSGTDEVTISSISVKEIATSYLTQAVSLSAKTWKIIYSVSDYIAGSVSATDYGAVTTADAVGITEYVQIGVASDFRMVNIDGYFEGAVTGISAQLVDPNGYWTLGTGWTLGDGKAISDGTGSYSALRQNNIYPTSTVGKSFKISFTIEDWVSGGVKVTVGGYDYNTTSLIGDDDYTIYLTVSNPSSNKNLYIATWASFVGSITNISVEQVDPNNYWTLGTGWSIGTDKAISTVTVSDSDITQSILTAGKTYRTVFEVVDYTDGTVQAVVTGSEGADRTAIGTYTEDLTATGSNFSIRSKLGTFDGSVSSVSAKLLGSYSDQSIYVTAADVQTIAQASVYYLVELTSMGSENSLYFIPSSVVANNGRYTKLNFTVVSKDALTQPTVGIISFYDSAGGFDTYPMGFYEFKIYEQTSSTNLDPLLATGLLEKGFAFVRDFSGNMQELTDGFNEYDPTLTQYVYSK